MAGVRSGISGWVIGLLIRGRAGAERRAANSWSPWPPVLADERLPSGQLLRAAVAEELRHRRSRVPNRKAAAASPDGLALCWILASAERDRSLNFFI